MLKELSNNLLNLYVEFYVFNHVESYLQEAMLSTVRADAEQGYYSPEIARAAFWRRTGA